MNRPAESELVPLADRLLVLTVVRLVMAAVVVGGGHAAATTATYVAVAVGAELARRTARVRGIAVVNVMLLVDGIWLATALADAPSLWFLLHLHVVAVTLLLSYRTGLKIVAWHTLLQFAAGVLGVAVDPVQSLGVWLVALGTAAFSSVSERELRRGKAELRAHAELAAELEETRNADEVASLLLAHAVRFFGFARGAVVLGPRCRVRTGDVETVLEGPDGSPLGVLGRTWETRVPALVHVLGDDDGLLDAALPFATNLVVVPMVAGGAPVGALVLEQGGGRRVRMRGRVVAAVAKLAAHAALALRNAALLDEVGRLAHVDALTGLSNRRAFEEALDREVARAARSGEAVSLAMFDIDHFKAVNDTLGHQGGDAVLRAVAAALADACRDADLPARYGGEEFAVLLPACGAGEAYRVAERLRAAVAATVDVTMSAGVAALPAHATSADELLRTADDALYAAKRTGRDRTVRARARSSRHAVPHRRRTRRGNPRPAQASAARGQG
ncbi:MAG TPA: GGDEF domain-containing protein [Acidimicrobiales bacterium]|nr:GGDEF domain-containing protein [Acidimicrobiales bacterium]